MNYLAEEVNKNLVKSNSILSKYNKYYFWFEYMKPYLDSLKITDYILVNDKDCIVIELKNGGAIYVPKGCNLDNTIKGIYADDDAICYIYGFKPTTHKNLIYRYHRNANYTFVLNKVDNYNSVTCNCINTNIAINSVLKGLDPKRFKNIPMSLHISSYFDFFHKYLTRDNRIPFNGTPTELLEKAFGKVRIHTNLAGDELIKAGDITIGLFIYDNMVNNQIKKWIMSRIDKNNYDLISFY